MSNKRMSLYLLPILPLVIGCFYFLSLAKATKSCQQLKSPLSPPLKVSSVIDRFTPSLDAVILLEDMNLQLLLPKESLARGGEKSTYLLIVQEDDYFVVKKMDEGKIVNQQVKSKSLLERLRIDLRLNKNCIDISVNYC